MARQLPSKAPRVDSIAALVTVAFLRELFHASAMWVYERIADGDFVTIKANGKRLITGASVTAYIERKRQERAVPDERAVRAIQGRQAKRAELKSK